MVSDIRLNGRYRHGNRNDLVELKREVENDY